MNGIDHPPQGRFVPTRALHEAALGRVLAGRDQQTGLPAIAILFSRARLNDLDRAWFVARGLKPVPSIGAPAIIDAQMSPHPWVAVAWSPADMGVSGDALPTRIGDTIRWFADLADAGPEVGIGHVLGALDRLEPRGAPGTVVLDAAPRLAPSATGIAASADMESEHAAIATRDGAARSEEHVNPSAAVIPPTKALPQAPLADAIAQWRAGGAQAGGDTQRPKPRGREAQAAPADATPRPLQRRKTASTRVLLGIGALSAAALGGLSWVTFRSHVPSVAISPPAATAPSPSPQPPTDPNPPPAEPAARAPTPDLPAESAPAGPAPSRDDDPKEPPQGSAAAQPRVTLETSPTGADVCDPKTGKSLGRTPLSLAHDEFHRGRRLVLTVRGHRALEMRWPPRKPYRFEPLGADEAQALSPCAF